MAKRLRFSKRNELGVRWWMDATVEEEVVCHGIFDEKGEHGTRVWAEVRIILHLANGETLDTIVDVEFDEHDWMP